jgi:hypothetical protein
MKWHKHASAVMLACLWGAGTAMAATDSQVLTAIDEGLANLASQQQHDGSWSYSGFEQAATGAAIFAFEPAFAG